jgi:TonB family protein
MNSTFPLQGAQEMAYSPTVPTRSNALEPQSVTAPHNLARAEPISAPDVRAIFSALGDAIATGTSELDTVLREIAEAAQDLTLASGTAVAIQRDGQVICVGRSGETAPGLGARLSIDSGISGECLRTGMTLRCDDTEKDYRADPEVCRKMRLRSIAAVPLFGQHGTIGVLEAFSTRTCAFAEEHMDYLARLAELAEAAHSRQSSASVPAIAEGPETRSRLVAFSNSLLQAGNSVAIRLRERAQAVKKGRHWAVAAGVLLLLSSVTAWRGWRKPLSEANPRQQIVQEDKARGLRSASASGAEIAWKPSPTRPLNGSPEVRQSAKAEVPDVPSDTETSSASSTKIQDFAAADTVKRAVLTDSDSDTAEAPQLSASNLENPKIGTLISVPVILPKFGTPISQGVSEGAIAHRVTPVYPRQALPLRLEGPVVLDATVTENGQLEDVKVVSGHAMLAQAAVDAVRQWRYRPYLLNGKPIRMQTKITVNFKMPGN